MGSRSGVEDFAGRDRSRGVVEIQITTEDTENTERNTEGGSKTRPYEESTFMKFVMSAVKMGRSE